MCPPPNKTPNFVKRIQNPRKYPFISNKDGSISTHKMAAEVDEKGNWYVFPTIVQQADGSLKQFDDPMKALRYNKNRGNAIKMNSKEEALAYAQGGYKKNTPLESFRRTIR
mgnify:CR=1 FL=1